VIEGTLVVPKTAQRATTEIVDMGQEIMVENAQNAPEENMETR
jgi:hypothetical protein